MSKSALQAIAVIVFISMSVHSYAQKAVAQFGSWTLVEGSDPSGHYSCGMSIGGFSHGNENHINIYRVRGEMGGELYVWEGRTIFQSFPATATLTFTDHAPIVLKGRRTYSLAVLELPVPERVFSAMLGGSKMVVEVDGFYPLTAKLDGIQEVIGAVGRCMNGETILPPDESQPLE